MTIMIDNNDMLVVKLGGGENLDIAQSCADLAEIARQRPLVIVHGASAMMAQLSAERDMPVQMLNSPSGHSFRYTNIATRDLFVEATQLVNNEIIDNLRLHGVNAVGITKNVVIHGNRKKAIRAIVNGRTRIVRDDYSGSITGVNTIQIMDFIEAGYVPVLPPMALSEDGLLNIDGDRASAAISGALGAEELVILSNVQGLFRNFPDETSLVSEVPAHQIDNAMQWAQGRMKRKVLGAQEAIEGGTRRVVIGDGRIANPVTQALQGIGTVFTSW
jgi:[amino group carrier protein]-L-2-aminoadipate 6-kinase